MPEENNSLLILKSTKRLTMEHREILSEEIKRCAKSVGMQGVVIEGDMDITVQYNLNVVVDAIEKQTKAIINQSELLSAIAHQLADAVEFLSEEDIDEAPHIPSSLEDLS